MQMHCSCVSVAAFTAMLRKEQPEMRVNMMRDAVMTGEEEEEGRSAGTVI